MKRKSKPGWNARSLRAKWRIFQFSERLKKSLGSRRSRSPIITHDCVITVEGEDLCPTLHQRGLSSDGKMAEGEPGKETAAHGRIHRRAQLERLQRNHRGDRIRQQRRSG